MRRTLVGSLIIAPVSACRHLLVMSTLDKVVVKDIFAHLIPVLPVYRLKELLAQQSVPQLVVVGAE
jgi:hypothetical protein